jgi:lipopolysaccharide export system protein LptA
MDLTTGALKAMKNLAAKEKIEVASDEKRYDELGLVSYFGNVSKKRGDLNAFHDRWIVMRGFDIYWF